MNIFIVDNGVVRPTPFILTIPPFKDIWDEDTSSKKEVAMAYFSYIEGMCSLKKGNPFKGYRKSVRHDKLVERLHIEEIPQLVLDCMEVYEQMQQEAVPAIRLFNGAVKALEQLEHFLVTVDLDERNRNGMPVYKPKEVYEAIKNVESTAASFDSLQKKIEEGIFESVRTKGNKEINPLER